MSDLKNQLAEKANNQAQKKSEPKSIKQWITAMEPQIKKALPKVMTPERFSRITMTAVSTNPKLGNCTPASFVGAMLQAAQLGLEPNTPLGQAYLIPYKNKGKDEVQFQIGYKGLIDLAHRSGEFKNIEARVVYENDEFEYSYGLDSKLVHKPALKDRGKPIAYYGVYRLVNGGFGFDVMSKEDIDNHGKKYSQSFNSKYSPWANNYDSMAKKTVLKQLLKYAPIKTEFVRGLTTDETIKNLDTNSKDDEIDIISMPSEPIEVEASVIDEKTGEINE